MKKGTKIGLGIASLLFGVVALSGCTNSFCTVEDKAHILYAIDHGVCQYFDTEDEAKAKLPADASESAYRVGQVEGTSVWYYASLDNCGSLQKIVNNGTKGNYSSPSLSYYIELDNVVLQHVANYAHVELGE